MTVSDFFTNYSSATVAGCSNQSYFSAGQGVKTVAFFRPFYRGKANFSLLFTSTIDSTYGHGGKSRVNDMCGDYVVSDVAASLVPEGMGFTLLNNSADNKRK